MICGRELAERYGLAEHLQAHRAVLCLLPARWKLLGALLGGSELTRHTPYPSTVE